MAINFPTSVMPLHLMSKDELRTKALWALWQECKTDKIGFLHSLGIFGCYAEYLARAGYIKCTDSPAWAVKALGKNNGWQRFVITSKGIAGIRKHHNKHVLVKGA